MMKVIIFAAIVAFAAAAPQLLTDSIVARPRTIVHGPSGIIDSQAGVIAKTGILPSTTFLNFPRTIISPALPATRLVTPGFHSFPLTCEYRYC